MLNYQRVAFILMVNEIYCLVVTGIMEFWMTFHEKLGILQIPTDEVNHFSEGWLNQKNKISTAQVSLRTMWWMPTRATGSPSSAPVMAPAEDISRIPGAAKVQAVGGSNRSRWGLVGMSQWWLQGPKYQKSTGKGKKTYVRVDSSYLQQSVYFPDITKGNC